MAGTAPFMIGADVGCIDGVCGKLSGLVIDPGTRAVTHLVVSDRQFQGRLNPVSLVDVDAATGKTRLRCALADFGQLDPRQQDDAAGRQRRGPGRPGPERVAVSAERG